MAYSLSNIEQYRFNSAVLPVLNSPPGSDYGFFLVPKKDEKTIHYNLMISNSGGWEHVSVTLSTNESGSMKGLERSPTWAEMCEIKDLIWPEEDTVIQYHPSKEAYVNNHPYCLHLWRPLEKDLPTPPTFMIGYLEDKTNTD